MKKYIIMLAVMLLLTTFVSAAGVDCTTDTGATSTTYAITSLSSSTYSYATWDEDYTLNAISSIRPTSTFTEYLINNSVFASRTTMKIKNESTTTLFFKNINGSSVKVYNSSSGSALLSSGNYSIVASTGVITWKLDANGFDGFNGTTVDILYDKVFNASDDLVSPNTYTTSGTPTAYTSTGGSIGVPFGVKSSWDFLDGTAWTTTYTYYIQTCTARDSCRATKTVIFAGFGLLAVALIVVAAFAIVTLVSGGSLGAGFVSATVIGMIALGVVLTLGYYIMGVVGNSIC